MEQRRHRPGDVLDDYCPRERRITDHAIVAMIDDRIKLTRCVSCDAEHEYKEGRIPAPRRRKGASGLFAQVLDNLQGPTARLTPHHEPETQHGPVPDAPDAPTDRPAEEPSAMRPAAAASRIEAARGDVVADRHEPPPSRAAADAMSSRAPSARTDSDGEDRPFRRSLIRATLPRPEGQPAPARVIPEFTIRQPGNARGGHRPGGRRRGGGHHQGQGGQGATRFGRSGHGPREHNRHGGSRRGGKKR
jgi:hypothetical protein